MIDLKKTATVFIGRRGEHKYRNLEFDVSSLLEDAYPGTALNAIYKRPDGIAYPVVTNYADGVLTWSPSATDTLLAGVGRLEIRVTYDEVMGSSDTNDCRGGSCGRYQSTTGASCAGVVESGAFSLGGAEYQRNV